MLREEELIRIARMRRAKPWQEERRYIQALILYAVADWPLVLKGGTYLWLFHGLNRFSADLGFYGVWARRRRENCRDIRCFETVRC